MKKNILTSALAVVVLFSTAAFTSALKEKQVKVKESSVIWVGKKVTGQHTGTISLKEGSLEFQGKELKGGTFVMDMTSLTVTDLEGGSKDKLQGHLKSDDFFGVDANPTAKLVFTSLTGDDGIYTVIADLTIKGKTNPIRFDLKVSGNTASTKLMVNRTKYDIKYGSGSFFDNLGDKAINDEFELSVNLVF